MLPSDEPNLPIELGPCSNGEFLPRPAPAAAQEAIRRTLERAERAARRRGMDRRRFLQTTCGAAATLFVLGACSREESASEGTTPGGDFAVPEEAIEDPEAAFDAIGGDEFVFDVQTHLLDGDMLREGAVDFSRMFPHSCDDEDDARDCFSQRHYLEEMFVRSDTSMAVISAIPIPDPLNALPASFMDDTRRAAEALCGDGRVFVHGLALPQLHTPASLAESMAELDAEHDILAWKTYTHLPGPGWWLDDRDPELPQVGAAFLEAVRASSTSVVCVHKGLNLGVEGPSKSPADVGPVAADHPDIDFLVYHSGFDTAHAEGPYDPDAPEGSLGGVDLLIRSLETSGLGTGSNVYAELGATWWFVMRDPDRAAHVLGKLLRYVGEDNVVWGTDSIWFGSPQGQIEALRAFEISEEFQETYGYPALTDEVKRKILGYNAARMHGIEPVLDPCRPDPDELEELRTALAPPRAYGPRTVAELKAHLRSHGALLDPAGFA